LETLVVVEPGFRDADPEALVDPPPAQM